MILKFRKIKIVLVDFFTYYLKKKVKKEFIGSCGDLISSFVGKPHVRVILQDEVVFDFIASLC